MRNASPAKRGIPSSRQSHRFFSQSSYSRQLSEENLPGIDFDSAKHYGAHPGVFGMSFSKNPFIVRVKDEHVSVLTIISHLTSQHHELLVCVRFYIHVIIVLPLLI